MSVKPLRDFVVVREAPAETKTESGLFIPGNASEKNFIVGFVVATGEGNFEHGVLIPTGVKAEDKVVFHRNSATELKVGGETLLMVRADQLMAVIS